MLFATGLRNTRKYRYLSHQIRNSKVVKTLDFEVLPSICTRGITHVSYDGRHPKHVTNDRIEIPGREITKEDILVDSLKGKLVYSSVLSTRNEYYRWKLWKQNVKKHIVTEKIPDTESTIPISLRHIYGDSVAQEGNLPSEEMEETHEVINMPYSTNNSDFIKTDDYEEETSDDDMDYDKIPETMIDDRISSRPAGKKWMSDYECYDEKDGTDEVETWQATYGTADSSVPISNVPCGGCGALLHCQDTSIPGYLPKELFVPCSKEDLKTMICQRCTFLKKYNVALDVTVSPQDYPSLMFSLRRKRALFIVMVDMMDYPCSIWPDLIEIIGESKPIIVVGNKIDLVPGDSREWLVNAKASLKAELPKNGNIRHIALISAKTGYGVEELITKLQQIWDVRGDVYLIGCTNVGKSTLFNALLQSDYCDVKAVDLILRATTSPWPGTTLNLLKFPIMKPEGWRLYLRSMRLRHMRITKQKEKELEEHKSEYYNPKRSQLPDMIGHIGMTFDNERKEGRQDPFDLSTVKLDSELTSKKSFDENSKDYKYAKWFYDTPGVVHPDQINDLLTAEELVKTHPRETIYPRMYSVRPNQTIFIAGLGRIDLHSLEYFTRIIIYASYELPITMCETCDADEVYEKLLGTSILAVPIGKEARLSKWPGLAPAPEFTLTGRTMLVAAGEIVISNIGWFTLYAPSDVEFKVKVWSPKAKGIHLRKEPLLVHASKLRKRRIVDTPGYYMAKP